MLKKGGVTQHSVEFLFLKRIPLVKNDKSKISENL